MIEYIYLIYKLITELVWLQSKRVCAFKFYWNTVIEYYVFNVYMPCDVSTCIDSYVEVFSEISNYCLCNNTVHFVIGGDFNTDVSRHNSCHTIALKQFVGDECLQLCLSTGVSTVEYTFTGALGTRILRAALCYSPF